MGRQYFEDILAEPPIADLTAVVATTETGLWTVSTFTPIPIAGTPGGPQAGKIYRLHAGGILSTSGSASTLTITPRYGTSTGGVTLGASQAQTPTVSLTNVPWYLQADLCCRAISTAASSSTFVSNGFITFPSATTVGAAASLVFGGTTATTCDTTVASGLFIGWTLTVAGSVTPKYVAWQALN